MEEEGRLPIRGSRKRPGFGTVGRRFVLNANRFLVSLAAEHLHCYSVSIVTEVGTQSTCRAILASLIAENRQSHLGGRFPACGGRSNLYTAGPLAFASKDFDVVLGGGGEGGDVTRMKRRLKVPIGLARSVDRCSANVPAQVLQAASVVLRAMIGEQSAMEGLSV